MKLVSKKSIEDKSDYYDMTIPDTHSYVLSETGAVVHNCGVGFSVQRHHVECLPPIKKPTKYQRFLIGDSIAGWADSVKVLMRAFLDPSKKTRPRFDFRDIREKGAPLITSGGKAPGPEPLKVCLTKIESMLENKQEGTKLTPLEVHDIACYLADAVLAGGIRRAAMISLFSPDDHEMMACKTGNWWEMHPQRARANNSVVFNRNYLTKESFDTYWKYLVASNSGEPGFFLTNDSNLGVNPCAEIALKNHQFCNLSSINGQAVKSQDDLIAASKAASFIGTLQSAYNDFYYLSPEWEENALDEPLLGVSITGWASGVHKYDLEAAAKTVIDENKRVSKMVGVKTAARQTCVKPEGTSASVLGSASGVHPWHAKFYVRRIRVNKNESIYDYLVENHPELIEDEFFDPEKTAVISIPMKAPDGAITRSDETAIEFLERVKDAQTRWVSNGHVSGANTHNVSSTVNVKEHEWTDVREWIWENRNDLTAVSCFPYSDPNYPQLPFEEITEERYYELAKNLSDIDLTKVVEEDPEINHGRDAVACAGGACEI